MLNNIKKSLDYHKDGLESLKLIHKVDSSAIPVTLLNAVVKAMYPYINFFLGAYIIDGLLAKDFNKAMILAGILIISNFIFGTIMDLLENVQDYKTSKVSRLTQLKIRKKSLEIDYETLENAKTLEKINSAVYSLQYGGGFGQLLNNYCAIFEAITSMITAIVLVIYLCLQNGTSNNKIIAFLSNKYISLFAIAIFLIGLVIFSIKFTSYFVKKDVVFFKEHVKVERKLYYYMNNIYKNYENGKIIRLYNMEKMINKRYGDAKDAIFGFFGQWFQIQVLISCVDSLLSGVTTIMAYTVVIVKILGGAISIGSLTKYIGAITQLNASIIKLIYANSEIKSQCAYLSEFTEFMKLKNKRETGTIPVEKRDDNEFEIEFHNVSFAYPGSEEMILKNVSCKINMKNKMAVVGKNGAGKTTFIKLIARLYDPTEGSITLNGIDIKKYNYKEYLKLFSVVFQDFSLFAFPLDENVASNVEVDKEKVWQSLNLAGVKEKVDELPLSIKTPLFKFEDEGVELSGGEQQKVAIARALYKDAPFVILDEPTAALDPVSEYEIYSRFNELVKDKTSIYISHRMSSCRFCDDIMVFDNGQLIQRGSHSKLIEEEDNLYYNLWNAQASYYSANQ